MTKCSIGGGWGTYGSVHSLGTARARARTIHTPLLPVSCVSRRGSALGYRVVECELGALRARARTITITCSTPLDIEQQ